MSNPMNGAESRYHPRARPTDPARHADPAGLTILLAVPHALDRAPLARLLAAEPGIARIVEVADAAGLRAGDTPPAPAVALVALTLPGLRNGIGLRDVRRRHPGLPIVALAPHEADECLALQHPATGTSPGTEGPPLLDCLTLAALQGARGGLRRSCSSAELVQALREVAAGGTWYDDELGRRIMSWARLSARGESGPLLSPREVDVAARLVEGRSNKEIAGALQLSEPSVKRHVGHLLRRFHLADRLQLGLFLTRHSYLLESAARARPSRAAGMRRGA